MRSLLQRNGAVPTIAPSMQEVPLDENEAVFAFSEELLAGRIDVVIFMTGVGARTLLEAVERKHSREDFFAALSRCCVIVRGPKPTVVLRDWKVAIDYQAAEPNTWRELLAVIDDHVPMSGKNVAIQEYGLPNEEFYAQLAERGAQIVPVPVYRWAVPDDTGPLEAAIHSTIAGEFDVLMFTSAQQLQHVLQIAERDNLRDDWVEAAARCVVASIGPTASETLNAAGLSVDVEASPTKMGHLVRDTMRQATKILAQK